MLRCFTELSKQHGTPRLHALQLHITCNFISVAEVTVKKLPIFLCLKKNKNKIVFPSVHKNYWNSFRGRSQKKTQTQNFKAFFKALLDVKGLKRKDSISTNKEVIYTIVGFSYNLHRKFPTSRIVIHFEEI